MNAHMLQGFFWMIIYIFIPIALFVRLIVQFYRKRLFCLDCGSQFSNRLRKRPLWPFLLLGPFGLLWKASIICPVCKRNNVIPQNSPRATSHGVQSP